MHFYAFIVSHLDINERTNADAEWKFFNSSSGMSDTMRVVLKDRLVPTLKRLSSNAKAGFLPGRYRMA